ncbi:MAG: N-acetylmuramoyl-L-alanine amidase [Ruminococcus sp.]|nr:N-acetylmuramoyl-L-alanine amidase [Ruminococcus sp.]MBR4622872.1 N-acetylmuramoyl-L-alanine amidase [Ruminococcus sp.]
MNRDIFRSIRSQLAPDETLMQRVVEAADEPQKNEGEKNTKTTRPAQLKRKNIGIAAAVLAAAIGISAFVVGTHMAGKRAEPENEKDIAKKAVDQWGEWTEGTQQFSVFIDPGKGGEDNGQTLVDEETGEIIRAEKDDNLCLALELKSDLEARGVKVILSREDDSFNTVDDICRKAEFYGADMFISLNRSGSDDSCTAWIHSSRPEPDKVLAENIVSAMEEAGMTGSSVKKGYPDHPEQDMVLNIVSMPSCIVKVGSVTSETSNVFFSDNYKELARSMTDAVIKTARDLDVVDKEGRRLLETRLVSTEQKLADVEAKYPDDTPSDTDILTRRLAEKGVSVDNCEYNEENNCLKLTIRSQPEGKASIYAKRIARNTLRYEAEDLSMISSMKKYNEVIVNSAGAVILESESDIMELPDFPECISLLQNRAAVPDLEKPEASIKKVTAEDVEVNLDVSSSAAGSTLHIRLGFPERDDEAINENIALIMREIDAYNQKDPAVHQVELTVNCGDELLVYMYADLIYRDFSYWQTPDMQTSWTEF